MLEALLGFEKRRHQDRGRQRDRLTQVNLRRACQQCQHEGRDAGQLRRDPRALFAFFEMEHRQQARQGDQPGRVQIRIAQQAAHAPGQRDQQEIAQSRMVARSGLALRPHDHAHKECRGQVRGVSVSRRPVGTISRL